MFGMGKKKKAELAQKPDDGWTKEEKSEWDALTKEYCDLLLQVHIRRAFYDYPNFRTKYPLAWAKVKALPEPPPRKL